MLFVTRISQDGNKRLCRTWLLLLTNTLTNLSTKGLDMKIINIEYNDYGDIIYTIKPFKNRTRTIDIKVDRWNKGKKPVKCYINNDNFFQVLRFTIISLVILILHFLKTTSKYIVKITIANQ